jgi:hypothetical protein
MVLRPADVHTKAIGQRYYRDTGFPSVISYEREFQEGRTGRSKLEFLGSSAEIGKNSETTARFLVYVRRVFASKQGRAELKKGFDEEIGDADILVSDLRIGRVRDLGVGPGSFDLPMTVTVLGLRTDIHISVFRVERVLGALFALGAPGVRLPVSALTRLARLMTGRMAARLGPKIVTPPAVSGSPQVGQTLTASAGTWTGDPTSFAYQWQRCDAAGSNCAAIAGATGQTYVVAETDVGSTIRVAVTARNGAATGTARSAPTAVAASAGPVNTALPAILGTPQVGQTLTATVGSWTGNPTGFGFQWQRCNASGSECAPIPGQTAGTYVVGASDLGSTLRVSVTATSATGSTTAVSAPTAPVT